MVNDAIDGVLGFELIVARDHDRFFRDVCLAEIYRRRLLEAGVRLVSVEEGWPISALSRRITPPFGYRAVIVETRAGKAKKRLGIEPSEAEILRRIFRLAIMSPSVQAIVKELNRQDLRTR
jgi:hypothetical protein